jgi:nucleotidyltransferase substrate binding protein (TIGR01987 family)
MKLDLSSLRKAVESLERALKVANDNVFMAKLNPDQVNAIRAGVIQNFEVAYEFCWKFIQRWLRQNITPEDAEYPRTRKELFRMAARFGLIEDPLSWFAYGDARNLSSHTYDEEKVESVYAAVLDFVTDARSLLEKLEERND